jgi:two-component system sensor histidine kinase RegB
VGKNLDEKILIPKQAIFKAIKSLIQNSIESSENPLIKIKYFLVQNILTVQIIDNGSGILPEIKSRIGEPFITSKPPGKGMGLGIFIAKLTANCYGGDLDFKSDSQGTIASLTFKIKKS